MPAMVSELWQPNTTDWNINYIANIFDNQAMQAITGVPIVPSDHNDIL
jgi:hypothetical protein